MVRSLVGAKLRLFFWLTLGFWAFSVVTGQAVFRNPVIPTHSPDPWVIFTNNYYYLTRTTGGDVRVYRAPSLPGLANATYATVFLPNTQIVSDIWAPELHYLDGKWYIYSTGNTVSGGFAMRMFVLEGNSQNPQGSYTFKGLIDANLPAIDATVLTRPADGARFLVWSQFDDAGQSLYLGPLLNPWTLGSPRIRIATPTYAWERNGNVNEGPQVLQRNGKTLIIYSGSGTWTEFYCLGALINSDGNYTNAASWTKFSNPVFQRSPANRAYCVGHASFTTSPSGVEPWLVYHGTSDPTGDQTPKRNTRVQRFDWYTDGTPNFDAPVATTSTLLSPDEAPGAPTRGLKAEFYPNTALSGSPTLGTNFTMDFNWGAGAPLFSLPPDQFSARWSGSVYAPVSGTYTFQVASDDGARLRLANQQLLISDWTTHSLKTNSASIDLTGGEFYDIRLEYFEATGDAAVRLGWTPPGGASSTIPGTHLFPYSTGLRAEFFSDVNFAAAAGVRLDPQINFIWGNSIPEIGAPANNFGARWTGRLRAPVSGNYLFHTVSDEAVRLWLGKQLVIDHWTPHASTEDTGNMELAAGQLVEVRLEYLDLQGPAEIKLLWTPPQGEKAVVPASVLTPANLPRNRPPSLQPVPGRTVTAGQTLVVTNAASDPDSPSQNLTFSLLNPPSGAEIDPLTGTITWRPTIAQAPATNQLAVQVADDGIPSLSSTTAFTVSVLAPGPPTVQPTNLGGGLIALQISGDFGPDYAIQATTNLAAANWETVHLVPSPQPPFTWTNNALTNVPQAYFRIQLLP